jgi:hypothetical protein
MSGSEVWDHVNATLDAGAWPAFALVFAIVIVVAFREQIGDRIKSARELNVAGATVKMDASREANEVLGENVPEMLEGNKRKAITAAPGAPAEVGEQPEAIEAGGHLVGRVTITGEAEVVRAADADREADAEALIDRREQIEEIIRASWRAGVETGQRGTFADTPEPNIVWTGTTPEIQGYFGVLIQHERQLGMRTGTAVRIVEGKYTGTVAATPDPVRRLEDEVRRLRERGADRPHKASTSDHTLYLELRDKLRRLDPNSPFA